MHNIKNNIFVIYFLFILILIYKIKIINLDLKNNK